MKAVLSLSALVIMLFSTMSFAETSGELRSVDDLEKERAVLGFLGLVADIATNNDDRGRWGDRDDRRHPPRHDRDRDRWDRDDRCRRYGDCARPNPPGRPGYPGYPGRPDRPDYGRPGYPDYGRPGYPYYPPARDYYVCYAVNLRGHSFTASDRSARYAQEMAMRECYRNSVRCEERGCYYYR